MMTKTRISRILFNSPWTLLLFFVVPLIFILNSRFQLKTTVPISSNQMLANNACLCLFIGLRLLYCLARLVKPVRYGADNGKPEWREPLDLPCPELRKNLAGAGYSLDPGGAYAEKSGLGNVGLVILYAGIFMLLFTGTYDNMFQFTGTALHSVGKAADLSQLNSYRFAISGPFTNLEKLPKIKIFRQIIPTEKSPVSGIDAVLSFPDGSDEQKQIDSSKPFRAGAFDIFFVKMFYEPEILVTINGNQPVYSGKIMLKPLLAKVDDFSFHSSFTKGNLVGEAFYQPEKSRLRLILQQGPNTLMNRDLIFQLDRQQTLGNISFTCQSMGSWSEIHVVHRRHFQLILLGALIALIGLTIRIVFSPQRIWIEEGQNGCRVCAVGRAAKKQLRIAG